MGLDIHSKSGLHFHIGYTGFMVMRNRLMESLCPGFGALHWWAVNSRYATIPYLSEKGWNDKTNAMEYEFSIVTKATPEEFAACCSQVLYAWCKANKLTAFWDLLICHSDCGGKLTAKQCSRLVKDLDKFEVTESDRWEDSFKEFRKVVREAANRNETLFFS